MDLRSAIDEFITDRESLGRKPKTLRFYRVQLTQFAAQVDKDGTLEIEQVSRSQIRNFFAWLNRRSTTQGTLAAYDRALRAFLRFCVSEGRLGDDPMSGRPRIKPPRSLPDTFDLREVARLLDTCENNEMGLRDRAIMLLMLDTGLRAGEVVELNSELDDSPELVNQDPHGKGWIIRIKIKDETELQKLMSAAEYETFLEGIED